MFNYFEVYVTDNFNIEHFLGNFKTKKKAKNFLEKWLKNETNFVDSRIVINNTNNKNIFLNEKIYK